ncbi:MAG: elongation factor G [Deltaproteobacteria bacterium]|nr:elongation factor G [Deltaproteobacteria bacterium]
MAMDDIRRMRTVGLLAEGGAGKTSLGEALLLGAGATSRMGHTEDGSSTFDFEPEEVRRKITLSTAFHSLSWKRHDLMLIDPPGYANFLSDTRYAMEAMSGAVFLGHLGGHLKVESERLWGWADELNLPRLVYLTRMDREEGSLTAALDEMGKVLETKFIAIQMPVGAQANFRGVIDLITMRALLFQGENGAVREDDIPMEMQAEADEYREKLLEAVAEMDDDLLARYLEGGEITTAELKTALRQGVISTRLFPVLCGAGLRGLGTQTLLDAIVEYLPSPTDRPAVSGAHPKTHEQVERAPDPNVPFSARVFKTVDSPTGRLSVFTVCSGKIESDSVVYNSTRDIKERFGHMFHLDGKKQQPVTVAYSGDVIAVAKLKDTHTGDTLCDEKSPLIFGPVAKFEPVISFALSLKSRGDEEKIMTSLHRLQEEDPALEVGRDSQNNDILLSGAGQLHIEVTVEKLKRKYGVEVDLKAPRVPYRETITAKADAQGRLKKQTGGRGQFGDTWLRIEPLPRGSGFEFVDEIKGGAIPRQYIPSVEKGVRAALLKGFLAGYPLEDIRVVLYDGSYHDVDSSDLAFQIAGSLGVQNAIEKARPVILEPVMKAEVTVPEEHVGDITGDLNRRRGRLLSVDAKGHNQIIKAAVPMAEILTYAPDLRSMTSGRGTFHLEFSHYEEAPHHLTEKIIQETKQAQAEHQAHAR